MKYIKTLPLLLIFVVAFVSCNKAVSEDDSNPYKSLDLTAEYVEMSEQGNDFHYTLLHEINSAYKGSFVMSPLSAQLLLGMLLNGAAGETANDIRKVLGFDNEKTEVINGYSRSLLQQLPNLDKKIKLNIANACFANNNYVFKEPFVSAIQDSYDATFSYLDFSAADNSKQYINNWCVDKTEGMIREFIDNVAKDDPVYLLDAVYFKGEWSSPFLVRSSQEEEFYDEEGLPVSTVMMMRNEKAFDYYSGELFDAVALPYGNGAYEMIVLLPKEGKSINDVTTYLTANNVLGSFKRKNVRVFLPRFDIETKLSFDKPLKRMGISDSGLPDFGPMSEGIKNIGGLIQKTAITVDEKGTVASAVSGNNYQMAYDGIPVLHANHPFLFMIIEKSTELVLFAGKYCGD